MNFESEEKNAKIPNTEESSDYIAAHAKEKREKSEKKNSTKREILSWVICLVSAFVIAMALRTFVFELVRLDGDSMLPTLTTDERLFVEKISKLSEDGLNIGDIIIVHYPGEENKSYVKRIVGLPGDKLKVENGKLWRNGVLIQENYTLDSRMNYDFEEYIVPEDSYFVMGDNRNDSMDSRVVGSISRSEIVGHAVCVIWPVWEFKTLN